MKNIKNKWLDALGIYGKTPSAENLTLLTTAKKHWKDELKSSRKKRDGARSQWWRYLTGVSKTFWAFLSNFDKPRTKQKSEFGKVAKVGSPQLPSKRPSMCRRDGAERSRVPIGPLNLKLRSLPRKRDSQICSMPSITGEKLPVLQDGMERMHAVSDPFSMRSRMMN